MEVVRDEFLKMRISLSLFFIETPTLTQNDENSKDKTNTSQ